MLFFVAIFAALCAFVFSVISAKITSDREERKDIIKTAISFCDELMNDSSKYWMCKCCDENEIEMGVLRRRISSYTILINRFLEDNFSDNRDNYSEIQKALEKVNECVSGLDFDLSSRKSDVEKAALSIDSIIQLRLIISKQKKQNYYPFKEIITNERKKIYNDYKEIIINKGQKIYNYFKKIIIKFILKKKIK